MGTNVLRKVLAVSTCKAARGALRVMKKGGTALPGKAAMFWSPDILSSASEGVQTIIVTGTNGKTTTCRILEHALAEAGKEPLANRSGANLLSGITAEFVCDATLTGKPRHKYAVIECDEAALQYVAPRVKPAVIVVTNLFRDQLDRYGEVMHTLEVIGKAVRKVPDSILCLNADDSLAASLALEATGPVLYYGIDASACAEDDESAAGRTVTAGFHDGTAVSDARRCIRCGAEYQYEYHTYAHLGGFYCPSCGYRRPEADVAVTRVEQMGQDSSTVRMRIRDGEYEARIGLPAVYNLYNAAAAVCACTAAGMSPEESLRSLGDHVNGFGRQEQFTLDGVQIRMILVKNPAGCNQSLAYQDAMTQDFHLVLCLNDRTADGHDISWIWDVDYERLCGNPHLGKICVFGDRAEDLCVRLKYAGIETNRIVQTHSLQELLDWLRASDRPVNILPNYTSMLEVRAALQKETGARAFWKG